MNSRGRWLVALCAAVVGALPLNAQDTILREGAIVRFAASPTESFRVAKVDALTADSIGLKECGRCRHLSYARAELDRLEIFRGSTRLKYAAVGLVLGAAVGSLVAGKYGESHSPTCEDLCGFNALNYFYGGLIGGAAGMAIGLMVGKEKWQAVR